MTHNIINLILPHLLEKNKGSLIKLEQVKFFKYKSIDSWHYIILPLMHALKICR